MSRSFQFGGYGGGGIQQRDVEAGVQNTHIPGGHTQESRTADKVVGLLDKMSFDETAFAHHLVSAGGNTFRKRILGIAIAIIKTYAIQYEHKLYQDDVAVKAMRLKDTCDQFKM